MYTVPPGEPPRKPDRGFLFLCLLNIAGSFVLFDLSKPANLAVPAFFAICALIELLPARYAGLTRWIRVVALVLTVAAIGVILLSDLS